MGLRAGRRRCVGARSLFWGDFVRAACEASLQVLCLGRLYSNVGSLLIRLMAHVSLTSVYLQMMTENSIAEIIFSQPSPFPFLPLRKFSLLLIFSTKTELRLLPRLIFGVAFDGYACWALYRGSQPRGEIVLKPSPFSACK